ncbi:DMT family transporter [Aquimarina sediminis]|uniref:DMT family transporter n=1 Tax=Aquimarina sediminis TaxID=2070536 RepID=UPI000CA08E11|nr:EamA family transporter [Aquimarina sediminis]
MYKSNYLLFIIPALIWGSTWYIIKYQLGVVDPIISVSYRFGLAGAILLGYSKLRKLPLSFTKRQHFFVALQGILLFGTNYWLVYISELYLSSGLVAVAFSTLIFLNIFFGALFLGDKIKKNIIIGAIFGLIGTILIYQSEFRRINFTDDQIKGLLFCIASITFASLGNITSAYNQRTFKLPVVQTNGFGMIYGAIAMLIIAIVSGKQINFDFSLPYISSLGYLAIFGSIIAFTGYLTLIGRVGASKAAYTIVVIPVIALTISTIFEGYSPDIFAFIGMGLIIIGNILALRNKTA